MKKLVFVFFLLACAQVKALEIADTQIDDKIQIDKYSLVLNGAGIRKKLMIKGFVGALYLEKKANTTDAVLADKGAKRMSYFLLRDVSGKLMLDRINEAIVANNTIEDMKSLETRFVQMEKIFNSVNELKAGDTINMDYVPGNGTRIVINGQLKGSIEGEDFYRSLLKNWIGSRPVQASLKKEVLGQE